VAFNENGAVNTRGVNGGCHLDGHCGAILKAYREHLVSKDDAFLKHNWPRVKKATEFIIGLDAGDGKQDGLLCGKQANTYDISFFGANTYVGSLYLGALKAAEQMALLMGDNAFAAKCADLATLGAENSVEQIWNGEYFVQGIVMKPDTRHQFGDGCLADQMFGQTWAHQLSLGRLYPEDKVESALESIWKYNWTTDVSEQNKVHHPERTYADAGEAGLLICTWPKSKHLGKRGVRYRNEVWTGIEYQVAACMINEGMLDKGLSIVKAVDERYDGKTNNPWNEIECGDHYARAMASWGVMTALQGFHYDGPKGTITFRPKIQKDNLETFFTAAEGWGNFSQKRKGGTQTHTLDLRYGQLKLATLMFEGRGRTVQVTHNGENLAAGLSAENGNLQVSLKNPVTLNAGDTLIVCFE